MIAAENSVADLPDLPFRRRAFLSPLATSFPDRFLVFERLGGGSTIGPTAYVHTKLLIVDTSGPGGIAPGTRGVVRDFRCNLWSKHFNFTSKLFGDFATCLTIWKAIISGNLVILDGNLVDISGTVSVRSYNVGAIVPRFAIAGVPVDSKLLELAWNTLEDPS